MTFKQLDLIEPLLQALSEEGYEIPTPIQAQAIPGILKGKDLLGCAQTGTGKTAAFALPMLQILNSKVSDKKGPHALILTPTRELAIQIGDSFTAYGRHTKLRNTVVFGGVGQNPQVKELQRGVDVLVATPGRLLDLMNQGLCSLANVSFFVLDEADRMLDMGFIHDVKKVIKQLPKERQTLLFSATMPKEIAIMADEILKDPMKVAVTPVSSTVDAIEQSVYFVTKTQKKDLLLHLLEDDAIISALVFTRTKHGANRVVKDLDRAGVTAQAIHGNKSQSARQNALSNFKNAKTRVLVATDIAARGIDLEELSHVINFDLPNIPETYVHRIGRTGRAGATGIAFSFCDEEERAYLKDIQSLIGKQVPVTDSHPYEANFSGLPITAFKPKQQEPRQNNGRSDRGGPRQSRFSDRPSERNNQRSRPQGNRSASSENEVGSPATERREKPSPRNNNSRPERPQSVNNRPERHLDSRPPRPEREQPAKAENDVPPTIGETSKKSPFSKPSDPNAKKGFSIFREEGPAWRSKPTNRGRSNGPTRGKR